LYTPIQHLIHNFNLGQVTFQLGTGVFQKKTRPQLQLKENSGNIVIHHHYHQNH